MLQILQEFDLVSKKQEAFIILQFLQQAGNDHAVRSHFIGDLLV
jgi:hypothetical protein